MIITCNISSKQTFLHLELKLECIYCSFGITHRIQIPKADDFVNCKYIVMQFLSHSDLEQMK